MQFQVNQSQKKFNPVKVELTFESQEELNYFYWLTNCTFQSVRDDNAIDFKTKDYDNIQMNLYGIAKLLYDNCSV